MMFALVLGIQRAHVDWDSFRIQIDKQISITNSEDVFRDKVDVQLKKWTSGMTDSEKEGYEILAAFRLKNSNLMFLSMGRYLEPEAFYVAKPDGSKFRIERVNQVTKADRFVPKHGVFSSGRIGVTGTEHSGSNYGHPGAASFRLDGQGWRVNQWLDCQFEGGAGGFQRVGANWVSEADGDTYPINMSTSHSAARVWMERKFVFRDGRFLVTHDNLVSSPMNTLDLLLNHKHRKDLAYIRRKCVSGSVAKTFKRVAAKLTRDEAWRIGDNGSDNTTIFVCKPRLTFRFKQVLGQWKLSRVETHVPKAYEIHYIHTNEF